MIRYIVLHIGIPQELQICLDTEYARKKGLYVEQIKAWRDACMNANGGVAREAARLNRELKDDQKRYFLAFAFTSEKERISFYIIVILHKKT